MWLAAKWMDSTMEAIVRMLGAGSALLWPRIARPQQSQRVPTIEEYNPKSTLVTKEHKPERAKFPSSIFTVITGIPHRMPPRTIGQLTARIRWCARR